MARPSIKQRPTLVDQAGANVAARNLAMDFVTQRQLPEVSLRAMFFLDPSSERRAKSMDGEGALIAAESTQSA